MNKQTYVVAILLVAAAAGAAQSAPPPVPMAFYGTIEAGGEPAPWGTVIIAKIDDERRGRMISDGVGTFGGLSAWDDKLVVPGDASDNGKTVTFWINGELAASHPFEASDIEELHLNVSTKVKQVEAKVEKKGDQKVVTVGHADQNATVEAPLEDEDDAPPQRSRMTSMSMAFKEPADNASLEVEEQDDAPGESGAVPAAPVIGYITISHTFDDDKLANVTFAFSVNKSFAADQAIALEEIVLYRFNSGQWTALPTSLIGQNDTHAFFEALSPGLSVFAIGGPQASSGGGGGGAAPAPATQAPAEGTPEPDVEQPAETTAPAEPSPTEGPGPTQQQPGQPTDTEPLQQEDSAPRDTPGVGILAVLAMLVGASVLRRRP